MTNFIHCSWYDNFNSLQLGWQISFIAAGNTNFIHFSWYDKFHSLWLVWQILFIAVCMTNFIHCSWYDEAKVGIFVHWGPYSVPGQVMNNSSSYDYFSSLSYSPLYIYCKKTDRSSLIINLKTSKNDKIKSKSREGNYE